MGQQISASAADGVSHGSSLAHASAVEGQNRSGNGEGSGIPYPIHNAAFRNHTSASQSPSSRPDPPSTSAQSDPNKMSSKTEVEVNRMSIRAAIDSFIENCLSASNDFSPSGDEKTQDSSGSNSQTDGILSGKGSRESQDSGKVDIYECSGTKAMTSSDKNEKIVKAASMKEGDTDDCELIIDCDENSTVEKKEEKKVDDSSSAAEDQNLKSEKNKNEPEGEGKRERSKIMESKLERKKEGGPDNFTGNHSPDSDKPKKYSPSAEKQSFSEYLQDRLKQKSYDKHEELNQLASNKDIQSHGQMLMWEMTKKPVPTSETAPGASAGQPGAQYTGGPVRLQALIDKVLDNSLNNQDMRPAPNGNSKKKDESNGSIIAQEKEKSSIDSSQKDSSKDNQPKDVKDPRDVDLKEQQRRLSDEDRGEASPKPKLNSMCFRDHIEKVLIESFLSYEEEAEERDKRKGEIAKDVKALDVKTDSERIKTKKENPKLGADGTISVQDIVDSVISQTEVISKLLTPTSSDASKTSSAQEGDTSAPPSTTATTPSHPVLKYQHMTPHGQALLEAQRHAVQKEHQSSATMGRKRGRPRLGSPMNNMANWGVEGKDGKGNIQDHRSRDMRNIQMPPGSHPAEMNSRSGGPSLHGHPHPRGHQGHPALDYASHGSLQYGMPVGISALMASQGKSPPSSAMFQQRHHNNQPRQQQQGSAPSSKSSSTMSISSGSVYHPHPQDSFHHRGGQHITSPNQPSQHRPGLHPGHPSGSKPPPPLILADYVSENMSGGSSGSRLVPVSHIPTKSCSCQSCVAHFSRDKSPSHGHPPPSQHHHHMRHAPPKQDRGGNHSPNPHPSHYHPYQTTSPRRGSKDFYPHQVPPSNSESLRPVVAVPGQGLPPQAIIPSYIAAQRQRQDSQAAAQISRDASSGRYYDPKRRNPSPGHYPSQTGHHPQAGVAKPTSGDPRYPESERHMPRLAAVSDHPMYDPDPARRVSREKAHQLPAVEPPKTVLVSHIPPASHANHDADQPLDLSVKPSPVAQRKDSRPREGEQVQEISRQSANFPDGRPAYRHPSSELPTRSQASHGHYGDYEQRGSAGHHLQRLENSVDRFLPHGQTQPSSQGQQFSPHQHLAQQHLQQQQQQPKVSPLSAAHPAHPEMRGVPASLPDRHGGPPGASHPSPHFHQESSNYRGAPTSLHPSQSPSSYHRPMSRSSPSQQQPQPQPHLTRPVGPSPTSGQYQSSRSPLVGPSPNHHRSVNASPHHQQYSNGSQPKPTEGSAYQRPPSHGSDLEPQASLGMTAPPAPPQSTPSPDEQEAQRLGVSKHEPIQNIIGSHPPSDILYLICRMCRQTYGSPYGFRKHFRNQHGFEPKAEHTIVQTISATKTAMAHTVPMEHADKTLVQQFKEEKIIYEDQHEKPQIRDGDVTPTNHSSSNTADDSKIDIRKDLSEDTKFLECPECGQTFQLNDFGSYKRHCRQHSLHRNSGPFACHDCQKSYAEPGQLQEHLDTHNTFTPSVCGICRTFFSSPNYLAEHLQAAHGHGHNSDGMEKGFSGTDSLDAAKKSEDYLAKSENLSAHGKDEIEMGEIKRSSSFSASSSAHTANSQSLSGDQRATPRSSSISYKPSTNTPPLPLHKRHRVNVSSADSQLFTVHTPKGLEIQKLPADAVVTTASPDSSYDEAKFHSDSQPGSSTSRRNVTTADATTSGDNDTTKGVKGETDTSHSGTDNKNGNTIINLPKQLNNDINKSQNKDETESSSSDRCASVESNNTIEGSRASTPSMDDADKFYKHKKYSRHRKRVSSFDVGNEPDSKCAKSDGSGIRQDQSPYSVSSTANSAITVRDCESSCLHSEDSNSSSFKSKGEDEKRSDEKNNGDMTDSKNQKSEPGSEDSKSGKKTVSADTGTKFKWDRQTRSQSGKTAHSVSYLSS